MEGISLVINSCNVPFQKLPTEMLHCLNLKQSKVRDLPIFLHCQSIVLPEIVNGQNVYCWDKMPIFFKRAVKQLKLGKSINRQDIHYASLVSLENK